MVLAPVASAILYSATLQLQKTSQLFSGKSLVMDKFGDELLKQLNQTTTNQQQSITSHSSARAATFIPGAGEAAAQPGAKSATSKRSSKKARGNGIGGKSLPAITGKR